MRYSGPCPICEAPLRESEMREHFLACVKIETVNGVGAIDWVDLWDRDDKAERLRLRAVT
jgi:hypothetical protein